MFFHLANLLEERRERRRRRRRRRGLSASLAEAGGREKEEEEGSLSLFPFLPEFPSSFFYFFSSAARFISREKKRNGKAAYSFLSLPLRRENREASRIKGKGDKYFYGKRWKAMLHNSCTTHTLTHRESKKNSCTKIGNAPHFFPYVTEEDTSANNAPEDKNNKYFPPYFRLCSVREGKEGE